MPANTTHQPVEVRALAEKAGRAQTGVKIDEKRMPAAVEAILLTMDRPVHASKLASAIRVGDSPASAKAIEEAIESLNEVYERTGRAFRVEKVAAGYRLMTTPEHAEVIAAFRQAGASTKLSRAAVETLAIVAYRQPATRAELEAIRGVACGEVLRSLLERRLLAIVGRAQELGRPMLYGTTRQFLELFGLASIKDLPTVEGAPPPVKVRTDKPKVADESSADESPNHQESSANDA